MGGEERVLLYIQPGGRRSFIVFILLVADISENRGKEEHRFNFSNVVKAYHCRDRINPLQRNSFPQLFLSTHVYFSICKQFSCRVTECTQ